MSIVILSVAKDLVGKVKAYTWRSFASAQDDRGILTLANS